MKWWVDENMRRGRGKDWKSVSWEKEENSKRKFQLILVNENVKGKEGCNNQSMPYLKRLQNWGHENERWEGSGKGFEKVCYEERGKKEEGGMKDKRIYVKKEWKRRKHTWERRFVKGRKERTGEQKERRHKEEKEEKKEMRKERELFERKGKTKWNKQMREWSNWNKRGKE